MKKHSILFIVYIITNNVFAQFNFDKCSLRIKENFSTRVLSLSNNYLLRHAHNENTLYLTSKNSNKIFSYPNYGVVSACIDNQETYLGITNYNKSIEIFRINKKKKIKNISKMNAVAFTLQFYSNRVFCGLSNGEILIDSINTSNIKRVKAHTDIIRDIKIFNDKLISISQDGYLKVWSVDKNMQEVLNINLNNVLTKIAITKDKTRIAVGCFDGTVIILNKEFKIERKIRPNKSIITQLKFKDNNTLITASFDRTIVRTSINELRSEVLHEADDYIINFDFTNDKFVYSTRKGEIFYYNLKCIHNN